MQCWSSCSKWSSSSEQSGSTNVASIPILRIVCAYKLYEEKISIKSWDEVESVEDYTYITIHNVNYYTNECWQQELNKFPISSENIINDINIKFQKIE